MNYNNGPSAFAPPPGMYGGPPASSAMPSTYDPYGASMPAQQHQPPQGQFSPYGQQQPTQGFSPYAAAPPTAYSMPYPDPYAQQSSLGKRSSFGASGERGGKRAKRDFGDAPLTDEQKQERFKTRKCKFFDLGTCTKGLSCPYIHTGEPYTAKPPAKPRRSNSYMSSSEHSMYSSAPPRASGFSPYGAPAAHAAPYTPYGGMTGASSQRNANAHNYKTQECKFFAEGRCTKGYTCPFIHPGEQEVMHIAPQQKGGRKSRNHKTEPCKFFAEGRCTKGYTCPYIHPGDKETSAGADPGVTLDVLRFKTKACKFFALGTCTKGEACTFRHPTDDEPGTSGAVCPPAGPPPGPPPAEETEVETVVETEYETALPAGAPEGGEGGEEESTTPAE